MYSIGKNGYFLNDYGVPKDGTVIVCFGDVDVRCHIKRHVGSENETVFLYNLADKYIQKIVECNPEYKIAIMSVVPPLYDIAPSGDPNHPVISSPDERNRYVRILNQCLKEICEKNKIIYVDIYDKYKNSDGFLVPEMSDYMCHINSLKFIDEILDSLFETEINNDIIKSF
jgi:lysophospholipase L1-like esterase